MENAIHMLDHSKCSEKYPGQMNSFVITTQTGEIIVIDGGYRSEWEKLLAYLRRVTGKEKPCVEAWFLTHAHRDHIGCFMEIVEHHWEEIEIQHVYYNFPSIQFLEKDNAVRAENSIREFYKLLPCFAAEAVIVSEGDHYEVGNAALEILQSPNPALTVNACNNSSLVIRLTLGEKKVLFLGDTGVEAGYQLLHKYGDALKSDYCQMAHHGQDAATKEVYESISPKVCIWCTPKWLWENDMGKGYNTHGFKTIEVRGWMEALGVKEHYVMKDGDQVIKC